MTAIDPDFAAFIDGLPKVELHLHIEGTLEPETIFALAERNGVELPYPDVETLRAAYAFHDLQSFLDIYYAGASVLLTADDFHDMAAAYLARAEADNVVRAEIFFDPQTHTARGVPIATVIEGLTRALDAARARGLSCDLILCFLRHLSEEDAFATLEAALPYRDAFIGIGLDSSEVGHPPEKFVRVFAEARRLGFRLVAHAGEEGPSAYIVDALDRLAAERIDHGVRSLEDPDLVARLVRDRIPLTVCPFSNVRLRVCDTLSEHPLKRMLDAGLAVTINSDDPAYFGGYVGDNWRDTVAALGMDRDDVVRIARNGIDAAFVDAATRLRLHDRLDAHVAGSAGEPLVRDR
ncbi:MAG: adenosine deaminase [Ancalomicrobiaceae bacterium]|nr:adenosine deaminase [Ancalomicrobiaceae bacterium]